MLFLKYFAFLTLIVPSIAVAEVNLAAPIEEQLPELELVDPPPPSGGYSSIWEPPAEDDYDAPGNCEVFRDYYSNSIAEMISRIEQLLSEFSSDSEDLSLTEEMLQESRDALRHLRGLGYIIVGAIEFHEQRVTQLELEISELKGRISALKEEIAELTAQIAAFRDLLSQLCGQGAASLD